MRIRDFDPASDHQALRHCVVRLQDFEREIDPRMPAGEVIADEYVEQMLQRCADCDGKILLAEVDGQVAGFATVLAKVVSEQLEDGDLEYALLSDLIVLDRYRKLGIGRKLLEAAEQYATRRRAASLRIGVLAANRVAERLYRSLGFAPLYVELEKNIAGAH